MRAIALAILLGSWAIEHAIRNRSLPEPRSPEGYSHAIVAAAFMICLIGGW